MCIPPCIFFITCLVSYNSDFFVFYISSFCYCDFNLQMLFPVISSIFINTAVIVIAAELAAGSHAGLTNFSHYLGIATKSRCLIKLMWGFAMFSSSQSSCATATYTGEVS